MVAEQQPRVETRKVVCTHCDRVIEIPATAMSVSCRHCHRRVIIEDLTIRTYHAVTRLATAGRVEVAKRGRLVARVRVNAMVVDGRVEGNVTALDRIEVHKRGAIVGDVSCRRLSVQPGAKLQGNFHVDPGFAPVHRQPEVDD
ncbi:MAG: polymer-forming cytoskeletal protein [Planctomycetota bacterium]|jgi:DNA-directed RNA polymerase subunit RPC12/RpoP